MKIISWNVNSVRARIANIVDYIKQSSPDILLLQEIKTQDISFPYEDFKNIYTNIVMKLIELNTTLCHYNGSEIKKLQTYNEITESIRQTIATINIEIDRYKAPNNNFKYDILNNPKFSN